MKYFFLGIFTLILFLHSPAYGEISEIDIDWIIENQFDDELITTEKNHVTNIIVLSDEVEIFSEFITNNQYLVGDETIDIHSKEGQLLNKLLVEQKKISKENFLHLIQYLDRYSDGYIELAEALLDPVKQQKYQVNGRTYDNYINSNLEYFLFERGYSTDNLASIPNSVFSPTKYDDARTLMSQDIGSGNGVNDLRDYIPNYVNVNDPEIISQKMTNDLFNQINIANDSIFNSEKINSITKNNISGNFFDDTFENMLIPDSRFENTKHVVDNLERSSELPLNSNNSFENTLLLILLPVIFGLAILGYVMYHKTSRNKPPLLLLESTSVSIDFEQKTMSMIDSSLGLFESNSHKEAFEKLGQAIRFYYCHKLNLNVELTSFEIIPELKKAKTNNLENITKWLLLCGSVEFTKHQSHKTEFLNILSSFKKEIS